MLSSQLGNRRAHLSANVTHLVSSPSTARMNTIWALLAVQFLILGSGCNHMTSYVNNRAGRCRYNMGQYYAAKDEFQRAIANNPRNPDYYHNLAAACCRAGDDVTGEQYYHQALSMDPTHQPSYHNLALLLQRTGRENEAGRLLQAWADTQPDSEAANIELAWYRKSQGDVAGAEQSLAQALQINPKNHIAAAKLGELYHEQGRAPEALALYEKSVHRRWDQPQVQARIAELKTTNPGIMPDQTFAARLSSPAPMQTVNMPNGSGTVESVAAFPLPKFHQNLWMDRFNSGTMQSQGTTLVSSPAGQSIPTNIIPATNAQQTNHSMAPADSSFDSSNLADVHFEAPAVRR